MSSVAVVPEFLAESPQEFVPPTPESIEDTGLAPSLIEQLIFKLLYFRGEVCGGDLAAAMGLPYSLIEHMIESLRRAQLVQVKRSLGVGTISAQFALTEAGRVHARDHITHNQYAGPAPVPLSQYARMVRRQRRAAGWLTEENLAYAYRRMVVSEDILEQVGPAVSSGNSFLIYGLPGNGKTYLAEALAHLDPSPVFLPYAIECQGMIIQVFDPIYHHLIEEEEPSLMFSGPSFDRRWFKCRRPFIVSGGELSLEMLDLSFNETSKVYDAPFQVKANNGIYLIDDFGRQKATPVEILNRWIVPMERRVDYLTLRSGGKITVPFESFLVFSTNLQPENLGDEAFLRRIQYKMLMRGPSREEFLQIFRSFCDSKNLCSEPDLVERFVDKYYAQTGRPFRRCHPRDVISHAIDLIGFKKLPYELTEGVLDRAFKSCFVSGQEFA